MIHFWQKISGKFTSYKNLIVHTTCAYLSSHLICIILFLNEIKLVLYVGGYRKKLYNQTLENFWEIAVFKSDRTSSIGTVSVCYTHRLRYIKISIWVQGVPEKNVWYIGYPHHELMHLSCKINSYKVELECTEN